MYHYLLKIFPRWLSSLLICLWYMGLIFIVFLLWDSSDDIFRYGEI